MKTPPTPTWCIVSSAITGYWSINTYVSTCAFQCNFPDGLEMRKFKYRVWCIFGAAILWLLVTSVLYCIWRQHGKRLLAYSTTSALCHSYVKISALWKFKYNGVLIVICRKIIWDSYYRFLDMSLDADLLKERNGDSIIFALCFLVKYCVTVMLFALIVHT